jgi:uncharacterized DUF497 family protein
VKYFDWNEQKNDQLRSERDVCFEDVLVAINDGHLLSVDNHPNPLKYPKQKIYVVKLGAYAYLVPFVEDNEKIFLKTIIPSRRATKKYLKGEKL